MNNDPCAMWIDPAHTHATPVMLTHAINVCAARRPDRITYRMLIPVSDLSPINWRRHGIEMIETIHPLGIHLSHKEQAA